MKGAAGHWLVIHFPPAVSVANSTNERPLCPEEQFPAGAAACRAGGQIQSRAGLGATRHSLTFAGRMSWCEARVAYFNISKHRLGQWYSGAFFRWIFVRPLSLCLIMIKHNNIEHSKCNLRYENSSQRLDDINSSSSVTASTFTFISLRSVDFRLVSELPRK